MLVRVRVGSGYAPLARRIAPRPSPIAIRIPDISHQFMGAVSQVQWGSDPSDWIPMTTIGPGVREIRGPVYSDLSLFLSRLA
jgi:hypothetical protein